VTSQRLRHVLFALATLCGVLALPLSAGADDGPDEVRRRGSCTRSSEIGLRLRSDDDAIRVEIEIEKARRGSRWSVILLHERRIAYRGSVRADSGGSIELRRSVPDFYGADAFVVRASGPRRETCRLSAAI